METNPTPEQAAKEAWEKEAEKRSLNCEYPKQSEHRMLGILDSYQASLKKMVEARRDEYAKQYHAIPSGQEATRLHHVFNECNAFLEMITTAMPPTK